jgi:hypothetical protein
VELHKLLRRHGLRAFKDLTRSRVSLANLSLLFIAQRQNAQGENLINLRTIEQRAGTFGRDLRVVI